MVELLTVPDVETGVSEDDVTTLVGLVDKIEGDIRKAISEKVFLSIVIPAYNEEKRIPRTCERIISYLDNAGYSAEVIIVDDGSTDRTVDVSVDILSTGVPVLVTGNAVNQGKGSAIRKGMLAARGEYVLFMDADMSTPIEELARLLPEMRKGYDIVIGSRKIPGADITVHQPRFREFLGKMFSLFSRIMTVWSINDFTCGFKCFRKSCVHDIFSRQKLDGWGYDTEILYIAHRLGLNIKEVPVHWCDSAETKVRLWRDVVLSATDLVRIRVNSFLGKYE